jgi:hypothetical protein
MIERFFLHRIDAITARSPVGGQHHFIVLPCAHKTHSALALVELAKSRADIALHAPVFESMPVAGRHDGGKIFYFSLRFHNEPRCDALFGKLCLRFYHARRAQAPAFSLSRVTTSSVFSLSVITHRGANFSAVFILRSLKRSENERDCRVWTLLDNDRRLPKG